VLYDHKVSGFIFLNAFQALYVTRMDTSYLTAKKRFEDALS
jgi:hypothetical protein